MAPTRWAQSADKHGIARADVLHAMRNARTLLRKFDPPRVEGAPYADLFIGPSRDGSVLLEIFAHLNTDDQDVLNTDDQDVLIFHVMPLRRSTIERVRRHIEERRNQG